MTDVAPTPSLPLYAFFALWDKRLGVKECHITKQTCRKRCTLIEIYQTKLEIPLLLRTLIYRLSR